MKKFFVVLAILLGIVAFILIRPIITDPHLPENSSFSIQFIDVGQADAALVECDGRYMLIDGGSRDSSQLMYSLLKDKGIKHLDIVVATHPHDDHIGGLASALNYASTDLLLCSTDKYDSWAFSDMVRYAKVPVTVPKVKDTYNLGSASITILGLNHDSEDNANNASIVLKIKYGNTSFLFAADAEVYEEQALLDSGQNLSADVLKIGHHGSSTSTSFEFLEEVDPQYAVISVGKDNEYYQPTAKVLNRLDNAAVTIYRTDLQGNIYATSDGHKVTMSSDRQATELQLLEPGHGMDRSIPLLVTEGTTYIINRSNYKFHYPDCDSVSKMKEDNRQETDLSRDELIEKGYKPCGSCNP